MEQRWCVVGAGYAGIAAARGLLAAGHAVEVLDGGDGPGGTWRDGAYDSTVLITSRETTAYPDRPFPAGTGVFPDREEMARYLESTARGCGVHERTRYGTEVHEVARTADGFTVGTARGTSRYDGVLLATGHHRAPYVPPLPGERTGHQLHSRHYRRPADLVGPRVLVVGAGNSAADIALEAARAGHRVDLAVKAGPHVVPKALLGRPTVELTPPALLPERVVEAGLGLFLRAVQGSTTSYGLPPAQGRLLASPLLHSGLLPGLAAGRVGVRAGAAALDGDHVVLDDGSREPYDTVVWATGYRTTFPMLDRTLLDGAATAEGAMPLLPLGSVTVTPGLLTLGLRQVRTGQGRYLAAAAAFLGDWARADADAQGALTALLPAFVAPSAQAVVTQRVALRELARARAALPSLRRLAARHGAPAVRPVPEGSRRRVA